MQHSLALLILLATTVITKPMHQHFPRNALDSSSAISLTASFSTAASLTASSSNATSGADVPLSPAYSSTFGTRLPSTPVSASASLITSVPLGSPASNSSNSSNSSTTASKLRPDVSVTLYNDEAGKFVSTPAPSTPSSGCAIVTQQLSTFYQSVVAGASGTSISWSTDSFTITPGLYCTCGNGDSAGTSVSTNNYGTEYIYCATGVNTASSQAIQTLVPSSSPGNASNPDWANVSCSYGSLANALSPASEQWADAGASAAWEAVVDAWKTAGEENNGREQADGFSNYLSNFFHSTVNFNCQELGDQYCASPIVCGQHNAPNADVDSPAGYLIMNSLETVHAILDQFYSDVSSAASIVNGQIGQFTSQFSAVEGKIIATEEAQAALQQKFDIIALVLDFIIVPTFGFFLRIPTATRSGIPGNAMSAIGSTLNSVIDSSFNLEELSLSTSNIIYTQNSLSAYGSVVTETWLNSTQALASNLFSGPSDLAPMIANGTFFTDASPNATAFDATQTMVQAFFANILAQAWSAGASVGQPFVLTSVGLTSSGGSGCSAYNPFSNLPKENDGTLIAYGSISSSLASDTCFEFDGDPYWLLSLATENGTETSVAKRIDIPPPANVHDTKYTFSAPYGTGNLNGTAGLYGGLNMTTVQANVLNTFHQNGQTNNFTTPPSPATLQDVISIDQADLTQAYGLVPIPVCSLGSLYAALWSSPTNQGAYNPAWPCPVSDTGDTSIKQAPS